MRCQYCTEVIATLDHVCPVRVKELIETGVSPGRSLTEFLAYADEFIQDEMSIMSECEDPE